MEFYTGQTGKDTKIQTIDFGTLDTAAYASGDILTTGAIAIESARFLGFSGIIKRIILKETSSGTLQKPSLRLWIFGSSITPATQNTAQSFSSVQLDSLVGYIDIDEANWINGATGVCIVTSSPDLKYACQSNSKTLYIVPEIKTADTFASGATIKGQVIIERD